MNLNLGQYQNPNQPVALEPQAAERLNDLNSDPRIAAISKEWRQRQEGFVWNKIFPEILVGSKIFKYPNWLKTFSKAGAETFQAYIDSLKILNNDASCYGQVKDINPYDFSYEFGQTHLKARTIPLKDCGDAPCEGPVIDPVVSRTQLVTQVLNLELEHIAISRAMDPADYSAETDPDNAAGGVFDMEALGVALNDPNADVKEFFNLLQLGRSQTMVGRATSAVMDETAFYHLANHPSLQRVITTESDPQLTMQQVANILGLREIHIAKAIYNSAAIGSQAVFNKFVSGQILLYTSPRLLTLEDQAIAFGASPYTKNFSGRTWFDNNMGPEGGDRYVGWHDLNPTVIERSAGTLLVDLYDVTP